MTEQEKQRKEIELMFDDNVKSLQFMLHMMQTDPVIRQRVIDEVVRVNENVKSVRS